MNTALNKILIGAAMLALIGGGVYLFTGTELTDEGTEIEEGGNDNGGGNGGGILPYQSGIRGVIMFGPTCPVVMDPPQDGCEDQPYQTLVAVFRANDPVHAIAITESDAVGRFEVSLPPGDYVVGAGEAQIPSCPQTPATVAPDSYIELMISCDSGIR